MAKYPFPKTVDYKGYCILNYGDNFEVVKPDNTKLLLPGYTSPFYARPFTTISDAKVAIHEDIEKEKNKNV